MVAVLVFAAVPVAALSLSGISVVAAAALPPHIAPALLVVSVIAVEERVGL